MLVCHLRVEAPKLQTASAKKKPLKLTIQRNKSADQILKKIGLNKRTHIETNGHREAPTHEGRKNINSVRHYKNPVFISAEKVLHIFHSLPSPDLPWG